MDNNQPNNNGTNKLWDGIVGSSRLIDAKDAGQFLESFLRPYKPQLDAWTREQRAAFLQAVMNADKPK